MIDCLIIGAGPAGLTAGIYLRRFHRHIRIVDAGQSRAAQVPLARNYPGFPDGISGKSLLSRLRSQLAQFGGEVTEGTVTRVHKSADGFQAEVDGRPIASRSVLLATGVVDVEPDMEGFEDVKATGLVRFCPICDGFEFTDQRIGVLGAGEHGVRETCFISRYSKDLSFIGLNDFAGLGEALVRQLRERRVKLVPGKGSRLFARGERTRTLHLASADGTVRDFDMLYCALGTKVRSSLATDLGAEHDEQYCLVVNDQLETSIEGMFAAGDVVSSLDQLAVAAGQAAIASTAIHNSLRSE